MKLGIALGAGGAKGFAHIGVLKALRDAGIECDIVTGTSIGALVGAAYAADALDALEEHSKRLRLSDIPLLLSPTISARGFFSGKNVLERLIEFIRCERIEDLRRKYAAVAADLLSGELVTFSSGEISTAVRASIAIPALFTPVEHGHELLVDGGMLEPVPVAAARVLGAEIVIGVDLFSNRGVPGKTLRGGSESLWPPGIATAMNYFRSLTHRAWTMARVEGRNTTSSSETPNAVTEPPTEMAVSLRPTLIEIVERTLAISQSHLTQLRFREYPADLVIAPPLSSVGLLDFHRGSPLIDLGYETAQAALPKLEGLLGKSSSLCTLSITSDNEP